MITMSDYEIIKSNLKKAEAAELAARLELVARSGHTAVGSKTLTLDGYKVSIQNTENISTYEPEIENVRKTIGDNAFYSAFKVKYEYSKTGAKSLTAEQQEAIEDALVKKPGTPQFKIVKTPDSDLETDPLNY